ncbi:MAG: hypothetical protein EOM15_01430 [Spirochaetia bacterium]|nr:hypothetical protein [Spirochaetia bacterium]
MRLNKAMQSLLNNWPVKVLSLVFALLVYSFINYATITDRVVTVPLEVHLPDSLIAQSLVPSTVKVHIKGDDSLIYLVDPSAIHASLDFSSVTQEGIASRAVVLVYDQEVFNRARIALSAEPQQFRVLFSRLGSSE